MPAPGAARLAAEAGAPSLAPWPDSAFAGSHAPRRSAPGLWAGAERGRAGGGGEGCWCVCMCLAGCTPRTAAAPGHGALPRARVPRSALAAATMFQPTAKRGFTIESLVAKDGGTGGGTGGGGAGSHPLAAAASEEPLRPTALNYPHPSAAEAAFVSGFPAAAGAGRSLYGGPELVFPEAMNHHALTVHPAHQLGASPLQPPHSFFGAQHRDPLHFYPWVLRNRFFGHRFQGECPRCARLGGGPAPALQRRGEGSGESGAIQKLCQKRLQVHRGRFLSREEPRQIHSLFCRVGFPPREPGWDLQAFPGMMPVRTPSPGASLEPLLVLPAACLNVSRLSQSHPRELSVGRPPSDPGGPGTILRSHFHHQLPGIRLRWRKETGESPPACPDSVGRRGREEGKLES